jgi:hypothetical protein
MFLLLAAEHLGVNLDRELGEQIMFLTGAAYETQRALRVLAVGLDYRRYARFELLVPRVLRSRDGRREVKPTPGLQVGDAEYQFCKQFVIETAFRLAEMDFDLDLDDLWRKHQRQGQDAQPDAASN